METEAVIYELRRIMSAGKPAWKWQVKGTFVWTHEATRQEAAAAIEADARAAGVNFYIEEKGL